MHDDALKELWQKQSLPSKPLPDEKRMASMERKMKNFDRTIRWRDILEIAVGFLLAAYYAVQFFRVPFLLSKVGCVVIILSTFWIDWRLVRSKVGLPKMRGDVALLSGIEIELAKVNAQIGLLRAVHWWYLLPLFVGFTLFDWGMPESTASKFSSVVVFILVGAFVYWLNQRAVKKKLIPLKQHLESLLNLDETVFPVPTKKINVMQKMILICSAIVMIVGLPIFVAVKLTRDNTKPPTPVINKTVEETMISKIVSEAVTDDHVGIVVGVIDPSGTKIHSAGKIEKNGSREVNGDTIFEIASITKVFTSLLLQDMVERGEINIDDPIEKFLPTSIKVPSKNGKKITLRHLATHRSGLPRLPDDFDPEDKDNPYADYTTEKLFKFLSSHKLSREPGEKYEYSNLGAKLLGLVLSRKAGVDYETLIVKRICEPLGMDNTRILLSSAQQANFATGHNGSGKPVKHWDSVNPLGGSGALRSSVNDLLKFAAANLAITNSTLSRAMQKTHVRQEKGGLLAPDVALGWHLGMEYKDKKIKWFVWHNGGTYGSSSYIGLNKEGQRAVVVLANSSSSVDDIATRLIKQTLFDEKQPKTFPIAEINPDFYDALVGVYPFSEKKSLMITREGDRLFVQITGQSPLEVFPRTATEFFCKNVNAQLTFEQDSAGVVNAVILHQNGLDNRIIKAAK